jgi:hypothetical protein
VEDLEMIMCNVCGEKPGTHRVRLGPWTAHLCDEDYMIAKQFVTNLASIKAVLHEGGIHIGVPPGFKIKRNAS